MSDEADKDQEKPKIIVDDDWKSQVQAEKEALKDHEEEDHEEEDQDEEDQDESEQKQSEDAPLELPPATFPILVTTFATQAMAALGQLPDPIEGKPVVRKEVAKFQIDMLGVLEEKTKGNLSSEESSMLTDVLHQLRMAFVAAGA